MTVRPQRSIAAFDSATAMLLALSRALEERPFEYLGQSPMTAPLVYASRLLPLPLRRRVYAFVTGSEGLPPRRLPEVELEQVAAWAVHQYPQRQYPAVVVGSSNGALTHLYAACGIPWLPQTWLVPVRRRWADPDDVRGALDFGVQHASPLLRNNATVGLHAMHDPNQDALSASQMAYFRIKWHALPPAYQHFLTHRLQPHAPIIVARDASTWPVTRVMDHHVFQFGAQGGMSPDQYQALPGALETNDEVAEAEWGFDDELLEHIRSYADKHEHPVVELRYRHPQDPAAAVADTYAAWLRRHDIEPNRLLVSSFIVLDPWQTIDTASVPYWTYFPTSQGAHALSDYLDGHTFDEIDIMLFSHGTRSRGLAEADCWQQLANRARRRGRLLGVERSAFPADFSTFARYTPALRRLPRGRRPQSPLSVETALLGLSESERISVRG
ncbi:hypothetical protein [Kribbella pittospori]|nr:hypothetical protein [Kribbella pittospori]